MSLIKGIHHIALKCCTPEEYEKTLDFYTNTLGLSVQRSWPSGTMIDTGCGVIEIFNNGDEPKPSGSIRHFALLTDDPDACVEAVKAAGYECFVEPKEVTLQSEVPMPLRVAFCYGPVGEEIEFFCIK